jgi:hypothetical protein
MNKIRLLQDKLDQELRGLQSQRQRRLRRPFGRKRGLRQKSLKAGKIAAETHWFYGVINQIQLKGWTPKPINAPRSRTKPRRQTSRCSRHRRRCRWLRDPSGALPL